ncbi:DUF4175 family protein [Dyadobacter crusticola]|uniref:DUF4175 family protein n=1 Tax=Dyadobacter crusticola TaxID=292407 RepID=UPI0004E165C7|nr:DUF4175 family protein [Dyadobacter crusticola]
MHSLQKMIGSVTAQLYAAGLIRCTLLAVSAFLLAFTFAATGFSVLAAGLVFAFAVWQNRLYENMRHRAITLIHRYTGGTEYSLDLLEKEELNIAEQMQLERLSTNRVAFPYAELYRGMAAYLGLLAVTALIYFLYPQWTSHSGPGKQNITLDERRLPNTAESAPALVRAKVYVNPPAYTGLRQTESEDLNVSAITGSKLDWQVEFSRAENLTVRLANARGEEVSFVKKGTAYQYTDRLAGSGLYSIKGYWKDSLVYQSDFYKLDAIPDLAPKIEPVSKELYKYHLLKDSKTLSISARISDDFQVRQAFIVATVARGSGENVKFREMRFPLTPSQFKEANVRKSINLNELNFTPGDELYYYWAAIDNRLPEGNFTKSDTYFVVYKDTAQIEEAELATMAVNIMPEYFRSQRQIIIDTEKLTAKRKKLDKKSFNAASNEIGYDQKLLRLRYGQYLGEEFETNIGGGGSPGEAPEGNIIDAFTHHSDGTGEGAEQHQAEGHAGEHGHDHGHEHGKSAPTESKDPLAALMEQYTHSHDDAETNTFYEESTRSLLKMALEQMWQSELHLRMYEPEKALPFENKALEYLKSAQQKARTYVKKSGYDPPPIKEKEKRLTGELKEIAADFTSEKFYDQKLTAQLAAEVLGFLDQTKVDKNSQARLRLAGSELSERLISQGPFYGGLQNWPLLAALQKLVSGKQLSQAEKEALKTGLYRYAKPYIQGKKGYAADKKLEEAFWKKLRQPTN